jgi:hypothetical protein
LLTVNSAAPLVGFAGAAGGASVINAVCSMEMMFSAWSGRLSFLTRNRSEIRRGSEFSKTQGNATVEFSDPGREWDIANLRENGLQKL